MPIVRWGKAVTRRHDVEEDSIITADSLRAFYTNTSCVSGTTAGASTMVVDHNLNVSPKIYGVTLLSHASAGSINPTVGRLNQSQMEIHLLGTEVSGANPAAITSGIFLHAYAIG